MLSKAKDPCKQLDFCRRSAKKETPMKISQGRRKRLLNVLRRLMPKEPSTRKNQRRQLKMYQRKEPSLSKTHRKEKLRSKSCRMSRLTSRRSRTRFVNLKRS